MDSATRFTAVALRKMHVGEGVIDRLGAHEGNSLGQAAMAPPAEKANRSVDRVLRHAPVGGELSPGHGDEPARRRVHEVAAW